MDSSRNLALVSTLPSHVSTSCPHPVVRLALLMAAILGAAPLHAQTGVRPPEGWSIAVFGGGAAFTDFQRSRVAAALVSASGATVHREFSRSIRAETSGALAGSISFWPGKNWGYRARAAYAPTRFETVIPQAEAEFLDQPRSSTDSAAFRGVAVSTYDLEVLFRLPTVRHRIMPYGILGAGVAQYGLRKGDEPVPAEAESFMSGPQFSPAVTVGLGAMLGLRPQGWALHFELIDQIARTPIRSTDEDGIDVTSTLTFMVGASWTSGR